MKCEICHSQQVQFVTSQNKYKIFQCKNCHFGWLKPKPQLKELKDIYNQDYFLPYHDHALKQNAQKKLKLAEQYLPADSKLLDFGSGLGHFLHLASKKFSVQGYELSPFAASAAEEKFSVPVKTGKLEKQLFPPKSFTAITCFDVIEHIPSYNKAFQLFSTWLKPGGFLLLTTPNTQAWDARILGKFWYGYSKIPEHVIYFSPSSLSQVLNSYDFKVIKLKNWGFVRSFAFLLKQIGVPIPTQPKYPLNRLLKFSFYLPLTDMFVIAKKTS